MVEWLTLLAAQPLLVKWMTTGQRVIWQRLTLHLTAVDILSNGLHHRLRGTERSSRVARAAILPHLLPGLISRSPSPFASFLFLSPPFPSLPVTTPGCRWPGRTGLRGLSRLLTKATRRLCGC